MPIRVEHPGMGDLRKEDLRDWINPGLRPKLPFHGPARMLAPDEGGTDGLIAACRTGRLSDVAEWIETGEPLQIDPGAHTRRTQATALSVAIDTGQHDLVHLLLAAGYRPELEPYSPFDQVLRSRRWDLLDLLLGAGADPETTDPDAVFGTYSREVMERFLALGVDLAGDGAMADTLATATSNRPLYGFVKNHADDPDIQREADMALGYAIGQKNDKAISMCLWAGANPRHSVPALGGGHSHSDDWTMTAFERAVWDGAPKYLGKLGFDPESDDIAALYEVAHDVSSIESLAKIQPPMDWHPIAERYLDRAIFWVEVDAGGRWGITWDLERIFQLGGRLRALSDSTKRRLRKHLRGLSREEAKRLLRLLKAHMEPEAFLELAAHTMFVDDYEKWGLKRKLVEQLAAGMGGSSGASTRARKVMKAEGNRPPTIQVPWNKDGHVRVSREELYEMVWSLPMVTASKHHGLSDNGLRKVCKKLAVPTPPRGHWAKRERSRRRDHLPAAKAGWPVEAWLPRPSDR